MKGSIVKGANANGFNVFRSVDELETISIENPRFVAVQFSSEEALKALLSELKNLKSLLVDDDKGNIVGINNYLISI